MIKPCHVFLLICPFILFDDLTAEPLFINKPPHHSLKDNDKDGVINIRDKCPNSQVNAEVDNNGCQEHSLVQGEMTLNLPFLTNSDIVRPRYYESIEKLAVFILSHSGSRIIIEGYSDNTGRELEDVALSLKRAKAIETRLVNHFHIKRFRIETLAYSGSKLIENNETAEERRLNRRAFAAISTQTKRDNYKWNIYSLNTVK